MEDFRADKPAKKDKHGRFFDKNIFVLQLCSQLMEDEECQHDLENNSQKRVSCDGLLCAFISKIRFLRLISLTASISR